MRIVLDCFGKGEGKRLVKWDPKGGWPQVGRMKVAREEKEKLNEDEIHHKGRVLKQKAQKGL